MYVHYIYMGIPPMALCPPLYIILQKQQFLKQLSIYTVPSHYHILQNYASVLKRICKIVKYKQKLYHFINFTNV